MLLPSSSALSSEQAGRLWFPRKESMNGLILCVTLTLTDDWTTMATVSYSDGKTLQTLVVSFFSGWGRSLHLIRSPNWPMVNAVPLLARQS